MKSLIKDLPIEEKVPKGPRSEIGTLARAVLVVVLAFTLVGALRWAVDVTNANARHISSNLTNVKSLYGKGAEAARSDNRGVSQGPVVDAK